MNKIFAAIIIISLFLFSTNSSFAATSLGNGLSCDGSTITQKNKTVSYSKAKSNLKKTIAALKETLPDANKKKKAKIQSKIAALKATQILVTSCNKGQLNAIDPIFTSLVGTYNGSYSGSATFVGPISGTMTMTFAIQPGTTVFEGELSFGGNLNSALNGKPLEFSGDVAGIAFPAQFVIQNTFLGTVTATVTQSGKLTIFSTGITIDSQLSGSNITGSVSGSYSIVSFNGTFSVNK